MPRQRVNLAGVLDDIRVSKLFKKVGDNQGTTLGKVSEMAAVSREEARGHLDDLEENGMVASATVAGKKRYFTTDFLEGASDVVDRNESKILENIPEDGFIRMRELKAKTELAPWVLENDLDELCSKGLVERKEMRNREKGFRLRFSRVFYQENVVTLEE